MNSQDTLNQRPNVPEGADAAPVWILVQAVIPDLTTDQLPAGVTSPFPSGNLPATKLLIRLLASKIEHAQLPLQSSVGFGHFNNCLVWFALNGSPYRAMSVIRAELVAMGWEKNFHIFYLFAEEAEFRNFRVAKGVAESPKMTLHLMAEAFGKIKNEVAANQELFRRWSEMLYALAARFKAPPPDGKPQSP